jgi:hypothetical protein
MHYTELIDKLVRELSYRVGVPNLKNKEHQSIMSEILSEWGEYDVKQRIFEFLTEEPRKFKNPILNRTIKYKDKNGKDKEGIVGNLLTSPKDSPGRIAAEKMLPADGTPERDAINKEVGSQGTEKKIDSPKGNSDDTTDDTPTTGNALKPGTDFAKKAKELEDRVNKKSEDGDKKEPKNKSKNKTLKQDTSSKPESFSKDDPTDEQFEEKIKEGKIKPQEYKEKTIVVNGKTYNQPISIEEVESFFEKSKGKIPPKYIKTLQRILNTKQVDSSNPPIGEFLNGAGAGEIPAQSGEILTFLLTSMDKESAEALGEVLLETEKNQKGKSILDSSWIGASISSRETILRQVKEKYGDGAEIEFGAWDTQDDVENGIGLENYSENKGFSTDVYFRVNTSDGPKIHEVSLKKDFEAYFANLGSTDIEKVLEASGAKLYDSDEDREKNSVGNLTKNQAKNSVKRVGEISQDSVDNILNQSDDELLENAKKLPPGIRSLVLSGDSKKGYTLSPEIKKHREFLRKIKDKYPLPWDASTLQNPDFFKEAKSLGINLGAKKPTQKGISKLMMFTNYMLYTNELANDEKGSSFEFLNQQIGLDKDPPEGSAKFVANKHIENLAKPESRDALMGVIGEKFPLKTLLTGEESMALGNQSLDIETCKQIFGTDNYDEIQEGISVEIDEEGNKFLSYTAKTPDAKPIKIAKVECRQRGQGYASPTTGIAPTDEFKHRIYCANKDKIESYSTKEEKAAKSLVKKFGECGSSSYD